MPEIGSTPLPKTGPATVSETDLTGTDTLGARQGILFLRNTTAGSVTINIDGDGATTKDVPGVGVVDLSAGYDITVAAGATRAINLGNISAYLTGQTIDVTGGAAGVFASVVN